MGKLVKILAPLVAVLAIAGAVFSFLVNSGVKLEAERAGKLAKALSESAAKLDEGTATGTASKVSYKAANSSGDKESGALSYKGYKSNGNDFEAAVKAAKDLASTVVTQRDALAEGISEICMNISLAADQLPSEDLKNSRSCSDKLSLAKDYAAKYQSRDKNFVKYLKKYAGTVSVAGIGSLDTLPQIVDKGDGTFEVTYEADNKALEQIDARIKAIVACNNDYQMAMRGIPSCFSEFKQWTSNVNSINEANHRAVLMAVRKDFITINGKLAELSSVKRELAEERSKSKEYESELRSNKDTIEDLNKKIKELKAKLPADPNEGREVLEKIEDVKPDLVCGVLIDNTEWNYAFVNKGKYDLVVGAELVFSSSDGNYLGSGKVTKVLDDLSMVEISRRTAGTFPMDARVLMGANVKGAAAIEQAADEDDEDNEDDEEKAASEGDDDDDDEEEEEEEDEDEDEEEE